MLGHRVDQRLVLAVRRPTLVALEVVAGPPVGHRVLCGGVSVIGSQPAMPHEYTLLPFFVS